VRPTTHRDPIKVRIVVSWQNAPRPYDWTYVVIRRARACDNVGNWPLICEGSKGRIMRDGAVFTRTWETSKDLCTVRVAAMNVGGSETPPGKLTVKVRALKQRGR